MAILTTNKLSAASVNNQPELDPNTFSLLLLHRNNYIKFNSQTKYTAKNSSNKINTVEY